MLMMGSGFGLISIRSLEFSLLNVRGIEGLEITAKSSATFGDIGDGVESPSFMMAVGGEDVYCGLWSGGGRGLCSQL